MSKYDFIVDNIRFSYSSTSSFETCAHAFKLSYIENCNPKESNFYAEYGTLIHECFEKYFTKELEIFELSKYFLENYDYFIKTSVPTENYGLADKYKKQGQEFFDNFSFNRDDYDALLIENKIDFELNGIMFTARPDLVLRNKITKRVGLYDYKSSAPFWTSKTTGKEMADNGKLQGYYKQLYIYAFALRNFQHINIDEMTLWFTRPERNHVIQWELAKEDEAVSWLLGVIEKIKKEEIFPYNNSKENAYFCNNLCGVRKFCEYR